MITTADITTTDFRSYFVRDFDYAQVGATIHPCQELVYDADITKAFGQAKVNFPSGLWTTNDEFRIAYLFLTAHFLVTDLQIAAQGVASTPQLPVTSRSVGSVSESYDMPEWATKSPILSLYLTTRYGQKYLTMLKPRMIGGVTVQAGATTPY